MKADKAYLILVTAMIILGIGMIVLPVKEKSRELSPGQLHAAIADTSRYFSVDQVARRIIERDPSLLPVDVRSPEQYEYYTLPGAVNIPLDEMHKPGREDILGAEGYDLVFFSNADVLSEQAWIIAARMGGGNHYVMKGGLNEWARLILLPAPPPETAPQEAFELYQFRKGASLFFTGSSKEPAAETRTGPVPLVRREKKSVLQGGC